MDIREFLQARLAEDDALARACDPSAWGANGSWIRPAQNGAPAAQGRYVLAADGEWHVLAKSYDLTPNTHHMARHDPARVLRDVEAKRRILAAYSWALDHRHEDEETGYWVAKGGRSTLLDTLHVLAAVWSDHPDYDPSWSPENVVPHV